jgi:hypothetical protein
MKAVTLALSILVLEGLGISFQKKVEIPTKPTQEYQGIMRSNAALVDLAAGPAGPVSGGREANIESLGTSEGSKTLRDLFRAKDYEGLSKGATEVQSNYDKLVAFWSEKNADDAVALAKAGAKAAADMQAAAKTKSDKAIAEAQIALERTCRDCHTAHRVLMLTDTSFQIRISPNLF